MTAVMVTGGAGFIGSAIAEECLSRGDKVVVFDIACPPEELFGRAVVVYGDVLDWPFMLRTAREHGVQELYHCAGLLGTSELMPRTQFGLFSNVQGTVNVLEVARELSMTGVFLPTKPNDWLNTYTISKVTVEMLGEMYFRSHEVPVTIMRWFNAYGPRQHVWPIQKVVPTFCLAAMTGRPLPVFGTGNQTVDMIYVGDMAFVAVEGVRYHWALGTAREVGSGIPITVRELADRIISLYDSSSVIRYMPMRDGEPTDSDIAARRSLVRDHGIKLADFDSSLAETTAYFRQHVTPTQANLFLDWMRVPQA